MWITYCLLVSTVFCLHLDVCPTKPAYCIGETCGVRVARLKLRPGCTCTPQDYAHTSTVCDETTHTRDIIFYWRPPATCRGGVDLPAPIIGVPCDLDCGEGRFLNYNISAEDLTDCDNCCLGRGQCDDLSAADTVGSCCPADSTCCSSDQTENRGTFTCCLFGTVCSNGDCVDVDANVDPHETPLLRCEECPPGRSSLGGGLVFDPPWSEVPPQFSTNCQTKLQGSCYPWTSDDSGQFLVTGDNSNIHLSTDVLKLELETVKQGQILFAYRYDAEERFDVFTFHVDSVVVLTVDKVTAEWQWFNHSLDIGLHTFEWIYSKDATTSKGQDKVFLKSIQILGVVSNDLQCDLCSPGRFMADYGARECIACPAGKHSAEFGALECTPCRPWEKSSQGASACTPDLSCTVWDTFKVISPCVRGARDVTTAWLQPTRCAMQDKAQNGEALVGPNFDSNGTVNVSVKFWAPFTAAPRVFGLETEQEYYVFAVEKKWDDFELWAENITTTGFNLLVTRVNTSQGTWGQNLKVKWAAESNQGYALPKPRSEPCQVEECEQGKQRNASGGCEYCPPRTVGMSPGQCADCTSAGRGASFFVSSVESFLNCDHGQCGDWNFVTSCQGECGTSGWRFGDLFADSGIGHNPGAVSRLSLDVSHTPEAQIVEVKFDLLLSCPMMAGRLVVLMDEEEVARYECSGCNVNFVPVDVTVLREARQGERSDHRLTWLYSKLMEGPPSHDCDFARIANVKIIADYAPVARSHFSGATQCAPCRPGFAGKQGLCEPCVFGTYSNDQEAATCTACEAGKFAYKRGSTSCLDCGIGQIANNVKSGCIQNCRLTSKDSSLSYDIETLKPSSVQVSHQINNENFSATIFISPCQPFHTTTVSRISAPPTTSSISRRQPNLPLTESAPAECGRLSEWVLLEGDDEVDNSDLAVPAHVCVVLSNGKRFSAGGIMNTQIAPPDMTEASFRLQYGSGVTASALNLECPEGLRVSTTISFICDSSAGVGQLQDVSSPRELKCAQYQLLWRSSQACHICTKNDMNAVDSACLPTGLRNRTYFLNQPQTCLNLGSLPRGTSIPCDPLAGLTDTHFVTTRLLGFLMFGTLVALMLAIVCLEVRHRILYSKYQSLSNVEVQLTDGARVFNFNESELPISAADDLKRDDELSSDSGEDN